MEEISPTQNHWLFSASVDLSVFLGSAVVSLLLLAVGWQLGILNSDSPDWTWISAILLIDVAHVWSTSFRVYFDAEESKRRAGFTRSFRFLVTRSALRFIRKAR